jgi:hypothetical protein
MGIAFTEFSDPAHMSDDTLLQLIHARYGTGPVPVCQVCGQPMSISHASMHQGRERTVWACSWFEPDPDFPKQLRCKAQRSLLDQHFFRSECRTYGARGDAVVLQLVMRYIALVGAH